MKYNVYRQCPEGGPFPLIDAPWEYVGSVERDCDPQDVSWSSAVKEVTGRSMTAENSRYVWYMVLPEGRKP